MLTEEAHHMFVGETGVGRVIKRSLEVMKELVRQKYPRSVLPEHPRAIDIDRERGIAGQYAGVGGGGFVGEIYNYGFAKAMLLAALSQS